ncbi:MAG: LamG domain-containing protein, partial [Prevotella sp.]|nr:LamG domain-containing protein [Prevotella sp.]
YKLHAQATVVKSDNTGIIVGIYKVGATEDAGTCIVRRKVMNNSGNASDNLSILYPFTVTEDGEYYVKIERGNEESSCTALAIHTSDYNPDDVDDSENAMTLTEGWKNTGLIVKIDFESENVGANCENIDDETKYIKEGKDQNKNDYIHFTGTVPTEGYKLYSRHEGDNKQDWTKKDVILHDAVFGNYFQNIPKAQFYDRSAKQNYMRAVLPKDALSPIKTSGEATIGFWVNGRVAVDAGLSYNDASMLYLTGPWHSSADVDGENNRREYQSMFNIRCNGNTNGFLNSKTGKQIRYYANDMFGDLCDNETTEKYYKKNLYLDRNWHYVTMVMYNGLRNVDMYVDGELTNSRKNIVGGDQDLTAGLDSINHIIIGGLNATYTTFGYDPAFAFDDIVIYSRALSSQEINQIITDKEYSPNSWDFEKNIANTALLNEEKLKAGGLWTYNESEKVYTLNKQLSTEAELTYDGNRVIPAFRGLKFKTGTTGQIQIDMANKRLKVTGITNAGNNATATKMTISNAPAGQYLRYEYDDIQNVWLNEWNNQPFQGDFSISNSKTVITNVSGSGRQTCTCNVNGTISFKSIGSTDKVYADLCFGTSTGETNINRVSKVDFGSEALKAVNVTEYTGYPKLLLIENGTGYNKVINFKTLTDSKYSGKIKFWSSAPHVAYITGVAGNQPTVKATGVPGSAYIYAELQNDNEYDCNNENAGLYESSSRIIARYEIHVPNKETGYSVKISNDNVHDTNPFNVGDVLETTDKAVTLTLGGWKYNSGEYFEKTDGYTKKEQWNGMPLKKTKNDTNGYSSEYDTSSGAATTDGDTYSALSSYTGGTHAASSEQMDGNP